MQPKRQEKQVQKQKRKINESLKFGDLRHYVNETFSIDRYTSKMGEDKDIVVLGFSVKDKLAANDLMSFMEKGYPFILDADMSTGEETNGDYQVFAEIQRSDQIAEQITSLLKGVGQLCDCESWKFSYRQHNAVDFSSENILEHVPTSPAEYENQVLESRQTDVQDFFDQGSVEVFFESKDQLIFRKPYAEPIKVKFIAIGEYDQVKKHIPGKLSLDESSQGQCFFLNKYLGTYDIDKIGNRFLISKEDRSIVIEKERW